MASTALRRRMPGTNTTGLGGHVGLAPPDTQEVFMAQDGSGASLVFEIVERADVMTTAPRYHFDTWPLPGNW